MKNARKKIIAALALALVLFTVFNLLPCSTLEIGAAPAIDTSFEAEQALRDKIDGYKDEKATLKAQLDAAKAKENATIEEKEYLDALIFSTMNEIDTTNQLIEEYTVKIQELDASIAVLEAEYETKVDELQERLHFSYVEGEASYLEMLLNSNNFIDFLETAERVSYLMEYDRSLMEEVTTTLDTLNTERKLAQDAKNAQETLRLELKQTEEELKLSLEENEKYLIELSEEQDALQADYDELKRLENEANEKIEQILAARPVPEPDPPKNSNSGGSAPAPSTGLANPMGGGYYISSEYGWRVLWGRDDFHLGIDMAAPTGSNVYASASGTVLISAWHYSYGYYILIDHGNGTATLYAHNSQLLVSEGQSVSQGQLIAKVGSTGSSSGPHLHFEVRVGGKTQNPRNYISF